MDSGRRNNLVRAAGCDGILGGSFRYAESWMAGRNRWPHFENQFLANGLFNSTDAKKSVISSQLEMERLGRRDMDGKAGG